MTSWDAIAVANNDAKRNAFYNKFLCARPEITAFVDHRLGWGGAGKYKEWLKGSFNLSAVIEHSGNGSRALIRFPIPGRTYEPWRAEKVANEVMVINYLREHTTIPVPCVLSWGFAEESPQQLGPFIIMDFVEGKSLAGLLKQPTENDEQDIILNPDIDEAKLRLVYDQIADYMLQLSQLTFPRIGAISKDPASGEWFVGGRPLTYNMNELATVAGYPANKFPTTPFDSARDYFIAIANEHLTHLQTHRNVATNETDAQWRFSARCFFKRLIPKYCVNDDTGSFKLFCDDLRFSNMLANPETLCITSVIDFEFTNAMPAQFAHDPPWWLLLAPPSDWFERNKQEEFLDLFVPRMEQFIRAVERAEERSPLAEDPRLSTRMRYSWATGRFWFNYASRNSLDLDFIYHRALHPYVAGEVELDEELRADMTTFAQRKMEQLAEYKEERKKHDTQSTK